jgi:hypothetical protein
MLGRGAGSGKQSARKVVESQTSFARVERNMPKCVVVRLNEWQGMIDLTRGAFEDIKNADDTWGRLMTTLGKKGRRGKRRVGRSKSTHVSTQTSSRNDEAERRKGEGRRAVSFETGSKRKNMSPLEDKKAEVMKRAKRGDITYTETRRRGEADPRDVAMSDSGGQWTVKMSRREKRQITERSNNEDGKPPRSEDRVGRLPRTRNRPEASLVKVWEGEE